ncbi:MAG: hypothetical protein AB7G37_18875 [Solirubrobacteraceae bacterium]
MPNARSLLLLCLPAAMALAGCGAEVSVGERKPRQISGAAVAGDITAKYAEQERASGVTLVRLTCEEVEGRVDAAVSCTGRNSSDVDVEIGGTVTKVDGDGLDYRWSVERAYAPGVGYARGARRLIEQRAGRPVLDVRCPDRVEVRVGATVVCAVQVTESTVARARLALTDLDGGFRLNVTRPRRVGASGS